jgi:hypothetical protein
MTKLLLPVLVLSFTSACGALRKHSDDDTPSPAPPGATADMCGRSINWKFESSGRFFAGGGGASDSEWLVSRDTPEGHWRPLALPSGDHIYVGTGETSRSMPNEHAKCKAFADHLYSPGPKQSDGSYLVHHTVLGSLDFPEAPLPKDLAEALAAPESQPLAKARVVVKVEHGNLKLNGGDYELRVSYTHDYPTEVSCTTPFTMTKTVEPQRLSEGQHATDPEFKFCRAKDPAAADPHELECIYFHAKFTADGCSFVVKGQDFALSGGEMIKAGFTGTITRAGDKMHKVELSRYEIQ